MNYQMFEMRIHGYGGQGAVTLGELIAYAALSSGLECQTLPFFGVERRGAPVKAAVRIAKDDIRIRSQSFEPDCLIVLNEKLLADAIAAGLKTDGLIWLNAAQPVNGSYPIRTIDATGIAINHGLMAGDVPYINIPFFGAICAGLELERTLVSATLLHKWPGKVGEKNAQVALEGYDAWAKGGQNDHQ